MVGATEVFSPLTEDYAKYRPGYPPEALEEIQRICGVEQDWLIADIGSGTGNLSRLFLSDGYEVIGVEPNEEMRHAAEHLLADFPLFHSIDGSAENTTLESDSIDLLVVGQALHWFDLNKTRAEFERVLRPDGWVAVLWNDRLSDATDFTREYDEFTSYCGETNPSPCATRSFSASKGLHRIFGPVIPLATGFPHTQSFDLNGLLGRARSSGFVPQPGAPGYAELTPKHGNRR